MKKLLFGISLLTVLHSCDIKESTSVSEVNEVEIKFYKEGELEFVNENQETIQKIDIEFADTYNKRARGLMDRNKMEDQQGMLFIFDDNEIRKHTFYMKNTRFPLDIMYFSADSTLINIARNAQPGADSEVSGGTVAAASEDSKFVVEVNGGLAEKWGLQEGKTKIRWTKNK